MRKLKITIFTSAILCTLSQIILAQLNFNKTKLDNYFQALDQNNKFMGSVAVSKNREIIYSKTIGFADVENKLKATENSKYKIGSISKSFTSVLVLKAVELKMLDLNQTIDQWFPNIENAKKINIKHLLSHRSGIHNFTDNKDYLTWHKEPRTVKEMIEIIAKASSDFEPDRKAAYSNSNYVLLTYILEKVFKKTYSKLLQEFIVKPIGLKNTYVFGKINTNNNECNSYSFLGSWKKESETDVSIVSGAGAISSTTTDLTKFADALFSGKLLTKESMELMKNIQDGYGLGLIQFPFYKSSGYGHTGGLDGFSSIYVHFPEEKISYALTSNGTNFVNNDISIAVLSAVYNKPYEIPVFTTYNLIEEDIEKYLGVYASIQIPLKITITKEGNTVIAQATGQLAFPLEATDKDKFKYDQAGVKIEFNPAEKTMVLFQSGIQFKFTRE